MIPCWPDDAADIRTLAVDTLGAMGESLVSGRKATDAREMPVFNPIAACVPRGAPDGRARGDGLKWRADAERARRLGFGAKLCIHPRQVDVVNRAFQPSDEERDWAKRVLDAAARAGGAAVAVDGKMVDKPVMLRAQAILDEAGDEASKRSG